MKSRKTEKEWEKYKYRGKKIILKTSEEIKRKSKHTIEEKMVIKHIRKENSNGNIRRKKQEYKTKKGKTVMGT